MIYRIGHGYQWEHLDLNLKNKYLADTALRQAIFTAINVKSVIDKTYGVFDKAAKPLGSHNFFPGDPNYKDVVTPTGQGSGDVEKAKKILTDAGYKIEGGKLITKTGEAVPSLRFRHTKGNQLRATTGELVQAALKNIGLDIKIEVTETLGKTLSTGDYDMIIFAWVGSPLVPGSAEQNWVTGNGGNYGKLHQRRGRQADQRGRPLPRRQEGRRPDQPGRRDPGEGRLRPADRAEAHADVHLLGLRQHPGQRDAVESDVQHPGVGRESGLNAPDLRGPRTPLSRPGSSRTCQ